MSSRAKPKQSPDDLIITPGVGPRLDTASNQAQDKLSVLVRAMELRGRGAFAKLANSTGRGEVSERLKEPASKAGSLAKPGSWVRIPPSPPCHDVEHGASGQAHGSRGTQIHRRLLSQHRLFAKQERNSQRESELVRPPRRRIWRPNRTGGCGYGRRIRTKARWSKGKYSFTSTAHPHFNQALELTEASKGSGATRRAKVLHHQQAGAVGGPRGGFVHPRPRLGACRESR
jgi:hypothetical protein